MTVLSELSLGNVIKYWFSKSIIDGQVEGFSDALIYKKALDLFVFDYKRYYPDDECVFLESVLLRAELQGILLYRVSREYYLVGNKSCDWYSLLGRYLSGFEIYYSAEIGKGLKIHHGLGTVVGARAKIGENCLLHQNITFGDKNGKRPVIGNNVIIYAGAKILGDVHVGNNAIIGANSVCLNNISENDIVAGIPAKTIKKI